MMQSRALEETESIARSRLRMFEQLGSSISWPFLAVLVFWISVLFLGFGLFARINATVTVALLVGALSVAGAIFLILELNEPYRGIMRISDEPLAQRDGPNRPVTGKSGVRIGIPLVLGKRHVRRRRDPCRRGAAL